jgi:RHS repeat-associated protein
MVSSGKVTKYDYDAAGRLTQEGDKSYAYGWLDKVMSVSDDGKLAASFDYGIDGQLSSRTDASGKSENFTWDGLALVKRDSTNFVNESAVTGGNPILAFGKDSSKVLFEDMLGSTVGSTEGGKFNAINRTSFGELESGDSGVDFFTGKPQVEGLGYAFMFRNYRADQGKWQTQDPMDYPDGWNNLAYCNNMVTSFIDWLGARLVAVTIYTTSEDYSWYGGTLLEYYEYNTEEFYNYLRYLYNYTLQATFNWPETCYYEGQIYSTGITMPTYAFSYGPPIDITTIVYGEPLTYEEIMWIFTQNEQTARGIVAGIFNSWKESQSTPPNSPHSRVIYITVAE